MTSWLAMFNGQMLFDRQMHVKMVCYFELLFNINCTEGVQTTTHLLCVIVLQDEKSLPSDDFRHVEKPPQLPRE